MRIQRRMSTQRIGRTLPTWDQIRWRATCRDLLNWSCWHSQRTLGLSGELTASFSTLTHPLSSILEFPMRGKTRVSGPTRGGRRGGRGRGGNLRDKITQNRDIGLVGGGRGHWLSGNRLNNFLAPPPPKI